ncbi:MAG TPA: hypothetical protein VIA08_00045 [Nitrososphaeraceae archaeon]
MSDSKKEFLGELKAQYEKEFELKNSLENKANYLLVASGIVAGLLFSFGANLSEEFSKGVYFAYIIASLVIGTSLFVVAILCSALALKVSLYRYATIHKIFYNSDGTFNEDNKTDYKSMGSDEFLDNRIDEYLRSNKQNFEKNEYKASKIKVAHRLFFTGMVTVPITISLFAVGSIFK